MRSILCFLSLFGFLCLSACVTSPAYLNPEAQHVGIGNEVPSQACEYISTVTVEQHHGLFSSSQTQHGAFNLLRNRAANLAGNYVVLMMSTSSPGSEGGVQSVILTGAVYHCLNL